MKNFLDYPLIDILLSHIDFLSYNVITKEMKIHYKDEPIKTVKCSLEQYQVLDRRLDDIPRR